MVYHRLGIIFLSLIVGHHPSPASVAVSAHSLQVTRPGQNLSLPCNLTSTIEVAWYQLGVTPLTPDSVLLHLLLSVKLSQLKQEDDVVTIYSIDEGRLQPKGDARNGSASLAIQAVNESDTGVYFCAVRYDRVTRFGKGIRLIIGGDAKAEEASDAGRQNLPCWNPLLCALPVCLLVITLWSITFCCYLGRAAESFCCCNGSSSLKKVDLHYASLRYGGNTHRSIEGGTGLAKEDVTYSVVALRS